MATQIYGGSSIDIEHSPHQSSGNDDRAGVVGNLQSRGVGDDPVTSIIQDLEDFFENGAIGLHIVGADGIILRANRTELNLLGYEADEYIGRPISDFHADHAVIKDILARLSSGQKLDKYPARLKAKDGTIRHVLITSSPRMDGTRFLSTRCFTMDVTDWKYAEEKVKDRDLRLAETYEHVNVGIAEADSNGLYLRVNAALCRITGYSREELLRRTFFDLTHPDDVVEARDLYRREIQGENHRYELEKRFIRKDGSIIFVKVFTALVRDSDGHFLYSVRAVQDINAQKAAEQSLRDNERNIRDLLDAFPVAVYRTDANGVITYYNKPVETLVGRAPVVGRDTWSPSLKLFWPDGTAMPHDECPMAIALKENRPVSGFEAVAERADGTRIPFLPFPSPLRDENGCLTGAVNVLIDLSERKEAEANQRLFLRELIHRVKNNMQMMHSLLRSAAREARSEDARMALEEAATRLGAMGAAQQALYDAGNIAQFGARSFLEAVSRSAVIAFGGEAKVEIAECVECKLHNDQSMPLALILNELITNAAKYGNVAAGKANVRVSLSLNEDRLCLVVADDGPGFDWSPGNKRASGLGLVAGLARQIGGSFRVDSAAGAKCIVEFGMRDVDAEL